MNKKVISKITSGALLCTMVAYTAPVFAFTKDETVYSKLDSSGSNYNTIVNSHIENEEQAKLINDISDLLNIENVNGDEEPNQDGNNLVWNADGSDIYYQGESQKELPIECNVKYELDDQEISAKELAGKSGKVKIAIEYTNKDAHTVNINGKDETLYTPFVVVCGTILDNEHYKNVEITNGKVVDDGSKTTVIGISLPGMQESLNISRDKIEVPNTIEITMDATDFELNNIVTYVTPKVIEENDLNVFDKIDEIYNKVDTLQSSSKQIEEGANTLKEGTDTYSEKSKEFNSAMNQVKNGTSTINSNYSKIDEGISSLNSGSSNLQNGAEQLDNGIGELSSSLSSMPQGIEGIYEGSKALNEGVNSETGLVAGVNSLKNMLTSATTTAITRLTENNQTLQNEIDKLEAEKSEVASQITTLTNLKVKLENENDKLALQTTIDQLTARQNEISTRIQTLTSQKTTNANVISVLTPTQESNAKLQALDNGLNTISAGTKSLEENLGKLNQAAGTLPSALTKLTNGSKTLANGTKELSTGASTLDNGSKALKSGIETLDTSTNKLAEANDQLTEGASTISEGTTTLAEGITKFNKEGIETICNYINGDLKDIATRLEELQKLSEEYNNFTMLNNGDNGNVKFIMIMDSVKKEEDSKQEVIIDNKNEENE